MRTAWLAVGAAAALVGAVLLFVPVVPQADQQVATDSATPFYEASYAGFSLTGSIVVSVSWTVGVGIPVQVAAAACRGTCSSVPHAASVTYQDGTSGAFTLDQPNGGSVIMGVLSNGSPAETVTFRITTALSPVASVVLLAGAAVVALGLYLATPPEPPDDEAGPEVPSESEPARDGPPPPENRPG